MTNIQSPVSYAIDFTILKDEPVRKILRDCVPEIESIMAHNQNITIIQPVIENIVRKAIAKVMGIKAYNELLHEAGASGRLIEHKRITERIKNA